MLDLDDIVKAYDIRGTYPDQIDADTCRALGVGFARFIRDREPDTTSVVIARDMRPSGPELVGAFGDGIRCVSGSLLRYTIVSANGIGAVSTGPGLAAFSTSFPRGSQIVAGSTWHFQHWYRDVDGGGAPSSNFSSAIGVTFE